MGTRVDCSAATYLPLCEDCTWRGSPTPNKERARQAAEQHAACVHTDQRAAAAARQRRARAERIRA